ncbi:MAG: PaaI family thioesterase [Sphingomonas sp.]
MIDERCKESFERQGLMRLIGAELIEVRDGRAVIEIPYRDDLTQQHGYFHAGVVSSIADNAAGYAAYSVMPPDASVLTIEFKINLTNPASGERLRAEAAVRKSGRTLVVVSATVSAIRGGEPTPCAEFLGTMIVLRDTSDDKPRQS